MRLAISKAGKPDGTLDPVFSSNGKKITDLGGDDLIYGGVLVQDDGKIVTLGYSEGSSSSYDFALARFNPNGTLDGTFGGAGKQETDLGHADFIHSAAVQSDGKIIAGGEVCPDGGPCDFALARYDEDGALDTSFGDGGVAGTAFPAGGGPHAGVGVSIQNDGRIVLVGQVRNGTDLDFGLARFEPAGDLDESFGDGGRVLTDFAGGPDVVWGSAIQANDRVVAAGGSGRHIALARYLPA
jgi:uncharacterized delta-60 repeat protein